MHCGDTPARAEKIHPSLDNLCSAFPAGFSEERKARAQTLFLKKLSLDAHRFYNGKIQVLPRAGLYGFNWFNVWYTPGVSKVSTTIRDNADSSFELTSRGNMVAVVSDSTRVLGDGDCTPPGGLGVMEGKAFLMKYLGGIDAVPLCIDSRNAEGRNDPDRIIEFVKMVQHSFGAVNLEDISQPNCFKVLDVLRECCDIPVWHDDAQGTACVTLAGVLNAVTLAGKKLGGIRIVLIGAGASNTTIARLLVRDGADPARMVMFDTRGSLHRKRSDIEADPRFYRKWELCTSTNPSCADGMAAAFEGADLVIALSTPGPDAIKRQWVSSMAKRAIVFSCANPVPEIYPYAAKEAGAFIVATGRGDFPNQVNNSIGFPGILKGTLAVRARKITDEMAIAAAHSLARFAENRGISPDSIVPTMDETGVFAEEAADVAMQAIRDGVARVSMTRDQVRAAAARDIETARASARALMEAGLIPAPDQALLQEDFQWACDTSAE
jgi:malate dehydrogenase (oxaloacetate-decarboxylating)